MIAGTTPGARGMEPGISEAPALYERFTITYPASGTIIESFYAGGATLIEVHAPPGAGRGRGGFPRQTRRS